MIPRTLNNQIQDNLFRGKVIILIGPRQVGKTTLIKNMIAGIEKTLFFDGDDPAVQRLLNRPNTEQLRAMIGENTIVFVDECQRISEIGLTAKIIVDQLKKVQLILSGSSAFDLLKFTGEPLTGRKFTYTLLPVSWQEWENYAGYLKADQDLENRLVYGLYPDILMNPNSEGVLIKELADSYLYKDVLAYSNIKKPEAVQKLVQALAWQIGGEVQYSEVGEIGGLDAKTVLNYIEILEKAYVIFRLPSFSKNLRNEIKKGRKIYFYDNGIRNAVIGQLQPFALRTDIGALWENFLVSERRKQLIYSQSSAAQYFWRTKQQQEIDYVEEDNGKIQAFEMKWNPRKAVKIPLTFTETYRAKGQCITRDNFREFLKQEIK